MTLDEIRVEIDAVDAQMKILFLKRMECSRHVAEIKAVTGSDVFAPERERSIIEKQTKDVEEVCDEYVAFLRHLMSASRRFQYGILRDMQDQVLSSCLQKAEGLPSPGEITECLAAVNGEIISRRQNAYTMKTTAVALCIRGCQAQWFHVGDSRLYHFYNGILAHYTCDHSVPQISVQLGEIARNEIPLHPDRSRLLRVLGSEENRPDIVGPTELSAGRHAFLLCSDGFWEYLREEEIQLDLCKSASPEQWIGCLRVRGIKRKDNDADNNTAVAVFIEV